MTKKPRWASTLSRTKVIIFSAAAVCCLALGLFTATQLWRARTALNAASQTAAASSGLPVSRSPLPTARPSAFDRYFTAATFQTAVSFDGSLFVAGRSALLQYAGDGSLLHTWRVGAELPPYPLTALAVRRGIGVPELWIGTAGAGVLVYQGAFSQLLPAAPPARYITSLLAWSTGQVLVGTSRSGVYLSDGKRLSRLNAVFANARITALAGSEDASWIGTRDASVWLWRSGVATHFQSELPDPQVLSLAVDQSSAWVGTPLGVAEFSNDRFRRPLAEGVFAQSLLTAKGSLWIGTLESGVLSLPLQQRLSPVRHPALAAARSLSATLNIQALLTVARDVVAVSPSALLALPSGKSLAAAPSFDLTDNHISALHVDARGRLWVGYFDRGLDILQPASPASPRHIENDVVFCVNRIKEDREQGTIAVATANGLALFDISGELRQVLDSKTGLIANHVTDLAFRKSAAPGQSALTVATPAGLTFVDPTSVSSISGFQGLVNNHVYTLAGSSPLLVGTLGGFSLLHAGVVEASYTTANSALRQNWITAAAVDGAAFYLGTYGSGVLRLEQNATLTYFREFSKQRIEINPNALLVTSKAILAGTAGQGLAVLPRGQQRWHFVRNGLPSLNITALASRGGVLYIGSDNGMVSVAEQNLP